MTMRLDGSKWWAGLATLALIAPGCGQDPFSPPTRPKPTKTASADSPDAQKASFFVYVIPGVPEGELEAWGQRAQREANLQKAIFRVMGPRPGESRADQPEVVRRAVADGASALIVVPGNAPELAQALADAESKGVPVVLLGRSISAPAGSRPFTVVDFPPFDDSARKIVETTLEDARKLGRTKEIAALLLEDKEPDDSSARRAAALRAAAESGGVSRVATATFDPSREGAAKRAVVEAVKANPDLGVVLAVDSEALIGASQARIEFQGKPAFFVGGYIEFGISKGYLPPLRESCYVEGKYWDLGSLAIKVAMARLRGEPVEGLAVLTPKFTRGQAVVGSEDDTEKPRPEMKDASRIDPPSKGGKPDPSGPSKP